MTEFDIKDDELFQKIEYFLNIASDYTRLKILYTLENGEKRVFEIQEIVGASQSLVSHQLAVLKKGNFVKVRKEGKNAVYSLSDEHVSKLLRLVHEHVIEEEVKKDEQKS